RRKAGVLTTGTWRLGRWPGGCSANRGCFHTKQCPGGRGEAASHDCRRRAQSAKTICPFRQSFLLLSWAVRRGAAILLLLCPAHPRQRDPEFRPYSIFLGAPPFQRAAEFLQPPLHDRQAQPCAPRLGREEGLQDFLFQRG